ncbi:PspC domain-containing protein [Listeria costaricensis]|uniref:PspC domain-containing protein n=1 Tax=Listeria costaricensis TaxID=2026604 RepID=UPI000C069DED|nr:PspC domain-containing protein [Listeria costaricensis]
MKKLRKSSNQKMLAGVCGGVAEYLGIDVTIVRIVWAIFGLFAFTGVVLYIVAALIMPKDTEANWSDF